MTDERIFVYTPSSAEEIRAQYLEDWRLEARKQPGVDPAVVDQAARPEGDEWITATAVANTALVIHANVRINDNDANALTATDKALDEIREAEGLPVVPAAPSTGSMEVQLLIPQVPTNIVDGEEFVLPNGKKGKVVGSHTGLTVIAGVNPEVPIQTVDTGSDTALAAGNILTWVSPPTNCKSEALVSANDPLTGGTDDENDARKRARILNVRQNKPAGGNWSDKIRVALDSLGSVQYAFVYPGLGGPSSEKVVIVGAIDAANNVLTRELSTTAQDVVRGALHAAFPGQNELVVQSGADETFDASIEVTLPNAATAGGSGAGWLDDAPWPPHNTGPDAPVIINSSGPLGIAINAPATPAPVDGQTHISWFSSVDQKFYTRLIVASNYTTEWVLQFDAMFVDQNGDLPIVGEYVSPAAVSIEEYGDKWVAAVGLLGPGENTTDAYRLPRAERHPAPEDEWPSDLTIAQLEAVKANSVISDIAWLTQSQTTPTVPGTVDTAPNVLRGRYFGIYQK
jgi:uncharacterized phage protein gp47/JayE